MGFDMFGFYLYETSKLTRFIDFHPTHITEGFFLTFFFVIFALEMKIVYIIPKHEQKLHFGMLQSGHTS